MRLPRLRADDQGLTEQFSTHGGLNHDRNRNQAADRGGVGDTH